MSFASGQVGPCRWSLTRGEPSDADVAAFVAYLGHLTDAITTPIVVLDLVHGITLPNAVQRQAVASAVAGLKRMHLVKAHALVTDSAAARGVLTTINWFVVNRPFAEKIFSATRPALRWLATELEGVDGPAILGDISDREPAFRALAWKG